MDFDKALESIKTIKLTGGIFGKTSKVLIVLCVCVAVVVIKTDSLLFAFFCMAALLGIVIYALKRVLDFAEKNPQAAIMEGAELLVHERLVHGSKGAGTHEPINLTTEHDVPILSDTEVFTEDAHPTDEDSSQTNSDGDDS